MYDFKINEYKGLKLFKDTDLSLLPENVWFTNFLKDKEEYYYDTYNLITLKPIRLKLKYIADKKYNCPHCPLYGYFCGGIKHNSYIRKIIKI